MPGFFMSVDRASTANDQRGQGAQTSRLPLKWSSEIHRLPPGLSHAGPMPGGSVTRFGSHPDQARHREQLDCPQSPAGKVLGDQLRVPALALPSECLIFPTVSAAGVHSAVDELRENPAPAFLMTGATAH